MASPVDFTPVLLTEADEAAGRASMLEMLGPDWEEQRGGAAWAGFAAEHALVRAFHHVDPTLRLELATSLHHDLDLFDQDGQGATVEVKTRAVSEGWTDPRRFEWLVVPTHEGREPIKDVDLVWACWYSMSAPRRLWVLGYVRGPEEFKRRAVYYREGAPLPRGGWAGEGGAWCLELKQLRPFPRHTFLED